MDAGCIFSLFKKCNNAAMQMQNPKEGVYKNRSPNEEPIIIKIFE